MNGLEILLLLSCCGKGSGSCRNNRTGSSCGNDVRPCFGSDINSMTGVSDSCGSGGAGSSCGDCAAGQEPLYSTIPRYPEISRTVPVSCGCQEN